MEQALFTRNIEGYDFHQTQQQVIIEISNDIPVFADDVVLDYTPEDDESLPISEQGGSICISIANQDLVYGKLFAKVANPKYEVSGNKVKVTLDKATNDDWPLLLVGPSAKGIDTKSQFLAGLFCDAREEYQPAWEFIKGAADRGHERAMLVVGHAFLQENPYGVAKNANEALSYFQRLYEKHREEPAVAYLVTSLLQSLGRYEEACAILKVMAPISDDMKLSLAQILVEKMSKPEEAAPLLEELVANGCLDAMGLLATLLEKGSGVEKNVKRANKLRVQSHTLLPPQKSFLPYVAAAGAALLAGVVIFKVIRRRK